MLSILCVGRVIFIHYFYCFLLLLLAQRREPDVIDFVCWSCNIHPLFLLFFKLLLLAQRRDPDVIDFVCGSCNIHPLQGSHRSGKSQGKFYFLKVREKSVNFEIGQ